MNDVTIVIVVMLAMVVVAIAVPTLTILFIGLYIRKKLDQRIAEAERRVAHLLTTNTQECGPGRIVTLVVGSAVYAADAAARNAHGWRRLVGGTAESMRQRMDSARRLATVRALEQASQLGAAAVLNMRYETSQIQRRNRSGQGIPLIEMIAYGTAWVPAQSGISHP